MGKDPAFLFYPNDYIGGTMGMTFEEKGAYIELLMLQFNRGHMTTHMIGQTVGQLWVKLEDKFVVDDNGLLYNKRLEQEINKRKNFVKSRNNNLYGENQYTKNKNNETGHMTKHTTTHMTSHMENENVNENIDIKEDVNNNAINDFFKSIWLLYPKKTGIGSVSNTQKKVLFKLGFDVLKKCIDRYLEETKGTDFQYIKMGSTFFNSGYKDYLDENYSNDLKSKKEEISSTNKTEGIRYL